MANLDGVKVGDRLWLRSDGHEGWFIVVAVNNGFFPIELNNGRVFTMDGKYTLSGPQVLFWDKVEIIPPPRPKRMVKKTLEGWVNVYPYKIGNGFHPSRESADEFAKIMAMRVACVHVTGEYEVEE